MEPAAGPLASNQHPHHLPMHSVVAPQDAAPTLSLAQEWTPRLPRKQHALNVPLVAASHVPAEQKENRPPSASSSGCASTASSMMEACLPEAVLQPEEEGKYVRMKSNVVLEPLADELYAVVDDGRMTRDCVRQESPRRHTGTVWFPFAFRICSRIAYFPIC